MSSTEIASFAGTCRIAVTLGLLACAGCTSPFGHPEDDLIGPTLQRLHEIETVSLESLPTITVELSEKDAASVLRLMEMLEDLDDTQKLTADFDISDEILEKLAE